MGEQHGSHQGLRLLLGSGRPQPRESPGDLGTPDRALCTLSLEPKNEEEAYTALYSIFLPNTEETELEVP